MKSTVYGLNNWVKHNNWTAKAPFSTVFICFFHCVNTITLCLKNSLYPTNNRIRFQTENKYINISYTLIRILSYWMQNSKTKSENKYRRSYFQRLWFCFAFFHTISVVHKIKFQFSSEYLEVERSAWWKRVRQTQKKRKMLQWKCVISECLSLVTECVLKFNNKSKLK